MLQSHKVGQTSKPSGMESLGKPCRPMIRQLQRMMSQGSDPGGAAASNRGAQEHPAPPNSEGEAAKRPKTESAAAAALVANHTTREDHNMEPGQEGET